mgnify:CR=1 FL=1
MYPKFIIAGDPRTGEGYLRLGMAINHKDLVVGYEKVWGGGWWARNDKTRTITLYGASGDFGEPDFDYFCKGDRELSDYQFVYTPVLGGPVSVIDTSQVIWI